MSNPYQPPKVGSNDRPNAGDRVVVTTGSFAGSSATVVEVLANNAEVEISVSGDTVAVKLPLQWLERANDGKSPP